MSTNPSISLAHGGGGRQSRELLEEVLVPTLGLGKDLFDSAILNWTRSPYQRLAMTTDSFVVSPWEFPGGNIGDLAACGTLNDLAVMGAQPLAMSCGLIIEEGFSLAHLKTILSALAHQLSRQGLKIATGDTKVVGRGQADGIYINTTAIGLVDEYWSPRPDKIEIGDSIIFSGPAGQHGATILKMRTELNLQADIVSDVACLWPAVQTLKTHGMKIHAMRDATRGGLAAVLNELCGNREITFEIQESHIPLDVAVQSLADLLGLDPWTWANEGAMVLVCAPSDRDQTLALLKNQGCERATCIGVVKPRGRAPVVLKTPFGTEKKLSMPQGEILPRIC